MRTIEYSSPRVKTGFCAFFTGGVQSRRFFSYFVATRTQKRLTSTWHQSISTEEPNLHNMHGKSQAENTYSDAQ